MTNEAAAAFKHKRNDMRLIKASWKPGKPIYSICFAASNPRGQ